VKSKTFQPERKEVVRAAAVGGDPHGQLDDEEGEEGVVEEIEGVAVLPHDAGIRL
jgi:hypothetical protein